LGQAHNCGRVKSVNGCPTNVKMWGDIEIKKNNCKIIAKVFTLTHMNPGTVKLDSGK
jgi:hypothetical protein